LDSNAVAANARASSTSDRAASAVKPSLLALIILTQLPAALTLTVTAPLLAAMAADLVEPGTSPYLIKLVTGIVAPALIVGAPLGGWLADRLDRRPLLVVFGSVFIVAATAPAFLDHAGWIVVSRFFAGACSGALLTIGMAMVGHYYDDERRPGVIGILAFLSLSSSVLTLPIAGAVATTGWRNAFFIFLAMVPLVLFALLRPPSPAQTRSRSRRRTAECPQRLAAHPARTAGDRGREWPWRSISQASSIPSISPNSESRK
jgi:MFS family permease